MTGKPAYDRESYRTDALALRRRGLTWAQIARELGMSLRTLHRIVKAGGS